MIGSIRSAVSAFSTGFAIGLSLIMAIGAQNAFVLRQGLMRHHMFAVALFCAGSDALLIAIGVGGVSLFVADFATRHSQVLFAFAAYGLAFMGHCAYVPRSAAMLILSIKMAGRLGCFQRCWLPPS